MKRVLSLFLALLMCLSLLPLGALADELDEEDLLDDPEPETEAWVVPVDEAHFPDDNFRAYLTGDPMIGYLSADGGYTEDELGKIQELRIDGLEIASLKGIEYFTSLTLLNCSANKLTSLDLSKLGALETLDCGWNLLTKLDVTACPNLKVLSCHDNQLTKLDVSACPKLTGLTCATNQITSLDIRGCPYLCQRLTSYQSLDRRDGAVYYRNYDADEYLCYDEKADLIYDGGTIPGVRETEAPTVKSLTEAAVTLSAASYTYNGKAKKPTPAVTLDGVTLKKGTDYTVSYKNNKAVGTATVTITGKGNYTGTVKAAFKINPKATKLTSVKNTAAKKVTAKWKKVAGVTGYQVQYAANSKFTKAKTVTVKGAASLTKVLSKLTKGKTYYVRVRTYQTVSGAKYYSAWSKVKTVKITK